MTTVSEQDEDRAQKLTDSAMKMYFGPVDAWPNGLANWFYKAIATALADVRREEREACAKVADAQADRLMAEAEKYHRREDWDQYEALECEAGTVGFVAAAIRAQED